MKNYKVFVVLFVCLLAGCSNLQPTSSVPTGTFTPAAATKITITSSPTHTGTPVPTQTALPAKTPTPTITLQPKPLPTTASASFPFEIKESCLNSFSAITPGFIQNGELIMMSNSNIYSVDKSGQLQVLMKYDGSMDISPYSGAMFYWSDNYTIHYISADHSERIINLPEMEYFRAWLNTESDTIILGKSDFLSARDEHTPLQDTFTILDLKTGISYDKNIQFKMNFDDASTRSGPSMEPLYDPTFTKVLFAWWNPVLLDFGMALWDVEMGKELWNQNSQFFQTPIEFIQPDWQLDGSAVFLSGGWPVEIYRLSNLGELIQLSRFSATLEDYLIFEPKISPDGNYLAFTLNADTNQPIESRILYILNLKTGIATNYCISPVWKLAWSPDSRQLAFVLGKNNTIILDPEKNQGVVIQKMPEIYGWRK